MLQALFDWIRKGVANAVSTGVQDGLRDAFIETTETEASQLEDFERPLLIANEKTNGTTTTKKKTAKRKAAK